MSNKQPPVLLVDTREKHPFNFEGDEAFSEIKFQKLDVGDYSLEGFQDKICIERKKDVNELINNFTANKDRLINEMERMASVSHKFMIIESELSEILTPAKYFLANKNIKSNLPAASLPAIVMKGLLDLIFKYNIHVIFAGFKARNITRGLLIKTHNIYGGK